MLVALLRCIFEYSPAVNSGGTMSPKLAAAIIIAMSAWMIYTILFMVDRDNDDVRQNKILITTAITEFFLIVGIFLLYL